MEIISVIGMVLGVAVLIYLTFKGVNGFVASPGRLGYRDCKQRAPVLGTLTGTYAASLGSTFGSYLFLFTIGSAYSELMKRAARRVYRKFSVRLPRRESHRRRNPDYYLPFGLWRCKCIYYYFCRLSRGCAHVPQSQCLKTPDARHLPVWSRGSECRYPGPSMLCIALSEKLGCHHLCGPHDGNCAPCSGFRLRHFLLHLGLQLPARPWNWLCSL